MSRCRPNPSPATDAADAALMRTLVDERLAQPVHILADAIEGRGPTEVRYLLDAIAVAQGIDLDDLHDGACDADHEARVYRLVEAADAGADGLREVIDDDF